MFSLFKKKKKPKPEIHFFPSDSIPQLLFLWDTAENKPFTSTKKYKLWIYIAKTFPEANVAVKGWDLHVHNVLRPYIIKTQEEV